MLTVSSVTLSGRIAREENLRAEAGLLEPRGSDQIRTNFDLNKSQHRISDANELTFKIIEVESRSGDEDYMEQGQVKSLRSTRLL